MVFDLKRRVIEARAEAAYALAEVQLEGGDIASAAMGFAGQARDLRRRGLNSALARRGWFGVLAAAPGLGADCPALGEAITALTEVQASDLDGQRAQYGNYRALVSRLLEERAWELARCLAQLLSRWFPGDPRPAYAAARALDAQVSLSGKPQPDLLVRALDAYDVALAAAGHVGARRQWDTVLRVRKAALWLRYGGNRAEACAAALHAVEDIRRDRVAQLAEPYRLTVAHAWLHASSSITRLRGLDLLESSCRPETHPQIAYILADYLRSLDWRYYPTEHDRALALARATGAPRSLRAHLALIAELHEVIGRRGVATVGHLEQLLEAAPGGDAEAYYKVAVHLAQPGDGQGLGRALPAALLVAPTASTPADSVVLAQLACLLRCGPELELAKRICQAASAPETKSPHGQAAWAVAVPVLLGQWVAWSDIRDLMAAAVRAYVQAATPPSFGFGALGARLVALDEYELATVALQRSHTEAEGGTERARRSMAAHCLERGDLSSAARWLFTDVAIQGVGADFPSPTGPVVDPNP